MRRVCGINTVKSLLQVVAVGCPLLFMFGDVSSAAFLKTQEPCHPDTCVQIGAGTGDKVLRSFKVKIPGPGKLQVTFNGSLACVNETAAEAVVDLNSQIVTKSKSGVNATGAGGLRLAVVVQPKDATGYDSAEAFSLVSKRVISVGGAGTKTIYMKVHRSRMDAGTHCYSYNHAFSVLFVGAREKTKLFEGAPCVSSSNSCDTMTSNSPTLVTSNAFKMPGKGSALVSLHGSLYCAHFRDGPLRVGVDIQITDEWSKPPKGDGPGGAHYALVLPAAGIGSSDSFNIAATRLLSVPGSGSRRYFALARPHGMDPGVTCYLYSMTLSAVFAPPGGPVRLASQPVCKSKHAYCRSAPVYKRIDARKYNLKAPSKGRALLEFRGALTCSNPVAERRTVTVLTHIYDKRFGYGLGGDDPGALSHLERLDAKPATGASTEVFNLASALVDDLPKGKKRKYGLGLDIGALNEEAKCKLYNPTFFSTFVPS